MKDLGPLGKFGLIVMIISGSLLWVIIVWGLVASH
jgi:hypothetical protein